MTAKRKASRGTAVHKARTYDNGTPGPTSLCNVWTAAEGILSTLDNSEVTCRKCLAWLEKHATRESWVLCTTHSVQFPAGQEEAHKAGSCGEQNTTGRCAFTALG
jgi:hypothetical protein